MKTKLNKLIQLGFNKEWPDIEEVETLAGEIYDEYCNKHIDYLNEIIDKCEFEIPSDTLVEIIHHFKVYPNVSSVSKNHHITVDRDLFLDDDTIRLWAYGKIHIDLKISEIQDERNIERKINDFFKKAAKKTKDKLEEYQEFIKFADKFLNDYNLKFVPQFLNS